MNARRQRASSPLLFATLLCIGCSAAPQPLFEWRDESPTLDPVNADPDPLPEPAQEAEELALRREGEESDHMHGRDHRVSLVLDNTDEEGDRGFTLGVEYEYHLDESWGIGGIVEAFGGRTEYVFLAAAFLYHPVPEVGFLVAPGRRVVDGDDDVWAIRTGMFYEFELTEPWTLGPGVYADFIEGGAGASVLAIVLSYNF